jgi:hypothetical protein
MVDESLGKRHCGSSREGMRAELRVASVALASTVGCFPDTTTAAASAAPSGSLRRYIGQRRGWAGRAGPARPWPSDPARVIASCPWRVGPGWRIPCPAVPHEHHLGLHACTVLDFVPCAVLLAISYIVVVSHNHR